MKLMRINQFYSHPKCISLFFAPESGRSFSPFNKIFLCATGAEIPIKTRNWVVRTELNYNLSFSWDWPIKKTLKSFYTYKPFVFFISKWKKKRKKIKQSHKAFLILFQVSPTLWSRWDLESQIKFGFPEISNQVWLELGDLNCNIYISTLKSLSSSFQTAKALGKLSLSLNPCLAMIVLWTLPPLWDLKKDLLLFSQRFQHKRNMWHLVYVDASMMSELTNVGRESSCFPMGRGNC